MNLARSIHRQAVRDPSAVAVEGNGLSLTYGELERRSAVLAHFLQKHYGVEPKARVAYLMPNRPEVVIILAAAWELGSVVVPLNIRLSPGELRQLLQSADPRVVCCDRSSQELAAAAGVESDRLLVIDQTAISTVTDPARNADITIPAEDDLACIAYTSGTTGPPKGATFTHSALLAHAANFSLECELRAGDRFLVSLPHHVTVTANLAPCLFVGATIVMAEARSFDGERFLDLVNRHRVTHTEIVPTQLYRVLEAAKHTERAMASMRTLAYGSAPAAADRVGEMVERYGPILMQLYGMTEIGGIGTVLRKQDHLRALESNRELLASAGQASYGMEVRVVDDGGTEASLGRHGEVWFRGPSMMSGYWHGPEQTRDAMSNGFVRSGDIGEVREDGFLYLVDRRKDIIIRGGQNLSTREIEDVIFLHPGVLEAAVVGQPDAEWGEVPVACVVRRDQALSETDLRQFCDMQGLNSFKMPIRFDFFKDLPKNSSGKVAKAELRDRYRQSAQRSN